MEQKRFGNQIEKPVFTKKNVNIGNCAGCQKEIKDGESYTYYFKMPYHVEVCYPKAVEKHLKQKGSVCNAV